jgi:hypothetical protein
MLDMDPAETWVSQPVTLRVSMLARDDMAAEVAVRSLPVALDGDRSGTSITMASTSKSPLASDRGATACAEMTTVAVRAAAVPTM